MKFSGKMCLKITLKVKKKQGFTLSLENAFLEKNRVCQIDPPTSTPSCFRAKTLSTVVTSTLHFVDLNPHIHFEFAYNALQ